MNHPRSSFSSPLPGNNYIELQWQIDGARSLTRLRNNSHESKYYARVSKWAFNVDCFPAKRWELRLVMQSHGLSALIAPINDMGYSTFRLKHDICLLTVDGKRWRSRSDAIENQHHDGPTRVQSVLLCSPDELQDETTGLFFLNYITVSARLWYVDLKVAQHIVLFSRSKAGIEKSITWSVTCFSDLAVGKPKEYVLDKNEGEESQVAKFSLFLQEDDVYLKAVAMGHTGGFLIEAVDIVNSDGQKVACLNGRKFISLEKKTSKDPSNWVPVIKMQELTDSMTILLLDDTLTINVKFTDYHTFSTSTLQSVTYGPDVHPWKWTRPAELLGEEYNWRRLAENFSSIQGRESDSDFKLKVGPVCIPVHKLVLCARSAVFDRMLKSDMLESNQNEVQVHDFSPESVRRLLQFMYTGDVPDLNPSNAMELYELADKYEVLDLRMECSRVLVSNLCAPYACKIASLAYDRSDDVLKRRLLAFIAANLQDVLGSPEWVALKKSDPELTGQVSEDLLLRKDNS